MDAITLLKRDHDEVKAMFREVEGLSNRATTSRGRLAERIIAALELHTRIEEEVFYPACRERAKNEADVRLEVLEAYEEHGVAKRLIQELRETDPKDEVFAARLNVLMESVQHHIKEEETELFKMARQLFDKAQLAELGERMAELKEQQPA